VRTRHFHRVACRTAAATAVLLLVVLAVPSRAEAVGVVKAKAAKTESVTSGKWLATVSPTTLTFTTNTAQTSTVANTGTIALTAISYKVTISNPATGSPTFTLFVCPVAWSGGTCSGGTGTQIGTTYAHNSTVTVSSAVVPAVGGNAFLQATPAGVTSSVSMTLGTSISSATQLRAAIKTNQ
jgi:hypothetical protein